jgi:hypothetical protein
MPEAEKALARPTDDARHAEAALADRGSRLSQRKSIIRSFAKA